jgi:Fuc2NAc and GlcNAc transferase
MHEGIVPRGGGLVIVGVIIMTLLSMLLTTSRPLFFVGLTVSVLAWATLSWCDDRFDLSPKSRFVTQGLIISITVALYGWVGVLLEMDLAWAGPVLSVIGIIWMANLNNFMDGMDGLASSQAIVGSVTFGVWFFYLGDHELAILCAAIASSSYGFLLWNWQPAKIFMGDVGSITLGGLFATLMIIAANRHNIPVLSLLMVFGVFIGDSTCTILNRMRKGERFWLPHRSHFYQRAGLSGVKHSKVVFTSVILMVLCSLIATLSILYRDIIVQLLILVAVLLTFISFLVMKLEKRANI